MTDTTLCYRMTDTTLCYRMIGGYSYFL